MIKNTFFVTGRFLFVIVFLALLIDLNSLRVGTVSDFVQLTSGIVLGI